MKYQFMERHRSDHRVEKMAKALNVSRSGYYTWRKREPSRRERENWKLLEAITAAYADNKGRCGSPRITKDLKAMNVSCSENRVARLMKINGIAAVTKRKFKQTTNSKHNHPVAENRLNTESMIESVDQVWVSDITYIWTREGWYYLAVILDLYSRYIVGWSLKKRLKKDLVTDALTMACKRRKPDSGLIFHSDQGVQYASDEVRMFLTNKGFRQSMSGKGNCYDNAFAESFFHTLKTELIYQCVYLTREQAREDIFEYIEIYYNRKRRHSALNYFSPFEFEKFIFKKVG